MRWALAVAAAAAVLVFTTTTAQFTDPLARVFNTWDLDKEPQYVDSFDHLALGLTKEKVHEEEHTRKKRNAADRAQFASMPIMKACERPGYTGQYCEFPICRNENPFLNPDQWETDSGFYIDITVHANCTRVHYLIVDDTLYDMRLLIQSGGPVDPKFELFDAQGNFHAPIKHEAGRTFYDATYTELSPGMYEMVPTATSLTSHCITTATGHTHLKFSGGFTTDERERNDFFHEHAEIHAFNSIILHADGLRSPGELKSVQIIGPNNYIFRPRLLDKRFGCTYEYYFDSLFCYEEGTYAMIVEGVDFRGNLFRRAAPFECTGRFATTAGPFTGSTTPAPIPTRCHNGGIMLHRPDNTAYCVCQDHWAGYECRIPICINGGTPYHDPSDDSHHCFCQEGFHGLHCEAVFCNPISEHGFATDAPELLFVIRVRQQMNDVVKQVSAAINQTVANSQFDPNYFSSFRIVLFNNDTIRSSNHYSSPYMLLTELNKFAASTDTTGGCTDTVFGSIFMSLLDDALTNKAVVYVITDALADDFEQYGVSLFQWNSYWKATVYFFFIEPASGSGCATDITSPGFRSFEELATRYNGLAWHISDRTQFFNTLYIHMENLLYRTQLMLSADRRQCSNGLVKTLQIERNNEQIIIVSSGHDFYPFLTDPNGKQVVDDLEELINHVGNYGMWRLKSPLIGQYIVKGVTSPSTGGCSFRVYQGSYNANSRRQPDLFWSIAADVDQDGGRFTQPIVGADNHVVFHLTEFFDFEPDRVFSALTMFAERGDVEVPIYSSNGLYREGCDYHFYFPAFQCRFPGELIHFEFYVRDNVGYYIQRAGAMTCANIAPTPRPPGECVNGGVETSNGTCLCQPHFYGKHCQNIACENGGSQQGEHCACAAGWTGYFCEYPRCPFEGPPPSYGYGVDMAFVIEITTRGLEQIQRLASVLPEVLRDARSQHRGWIERFVLVGYNGTWANILVDAPADQYGRVITRINEIANSTVTDKSCTVRPWQALRRLFRERTFGSGVRGIPRRSVINLYETGIPDEFDGGEEAYIIGEEIITKFLIMNVFQAKDPNGNGTEWFCSAHNGAFRRLEQAARRGDGRFYTIESKEIHRAAMMIPSLFSSSIVYKSYAENCTNPQNVYFPIDAYTQTVTAIVAGHKSNFTLSRFDGTVISDHKYFVNIFHDDNQAVTEIRRPCDSGWEEIQQYCVYANSNAPLLNFAAATAYCHAERAFLLDDQSDAKNEWIKTRTSKNVWLGLQYVNAKWVFQHDNGSTSDATQNYWQGGSAPDPNTGKTCAYYSPSSTNGYWVGTTCDQLYMPVCQKHRYNQYHTPSAIGADDLAPGKYIFTVQTDGPRKEGWSGCSVEIKVQSDINIEWGIVNNIRDDYPTAVMNIDSLNNYVLATVSEGRTRTSRANVKHVQLRTDDRNSVLLEAAVYQPRAGCSYEYYSQPLRCDLTNGSDVSVVHIGEDSSGNTFQRYTTTFCTKWVFECLNGGVYSNGACVCRDYFTGGYCETPICQNGGTLEGDRFCRCPEGYGGEACEFATCHRRSNTTFSNNNRRLVLLVEQSTNTKTALSNLASNLVSIVQAAEEHHSRWFNAYTIHHFTPDGITQAISTFNNAADAATQLQSISDGAAETGYCQMRLFEALGDLFTSQAPAMDGAEVLLITAATPIDHDQDNIFDAIRNFGTRSPIVDFIRIETSACPVSDVASNLTHFSHFISSTNGILSRVNPSDVGNALMKFLPSRYAPQRLSYTNPRGCSNEVFFVQIDLNTTNVHISIAGKQGSVIINDSKGDQLPSSNIETLFQSNTMSLFHFSPSFPGIYRVQTSSSDVVCYPVIYGTGGVQVIVGFVQDLMSRDDATPYAVRGSFNYPVFHLVDPDDSRFERGFLYHTNFVRHSSTGQDVAPYKSQLDARFGCRYSYIGQAFRCSDTGDERITLSVSGADTLRQNFVRHTSTWCKSFNGASTPSTPPPSTTPYVSPSGSTVTIPTVPTTTVATPSTTPTPRPLTPKDIQIDILFLIDETETDGFQNFTGIPFIVNLLNICTINQAHARVGIITIPNNADSTMPVTFLSAINNYDSLLANLYQINDFLDNDSPSQARMTRALQYSHGRFKFPANGYRDNINNHLIVILTETSTITDKPTAVQEAAAILIENSFGIITVGYGPKANLNDLTPLAGSDCTFVAADWNALSGTVTKSIQDKIWSAFNQTQGRYCGEPTNAIPI